MIFVAHPESSTTNLYASTDYSSLLINEIVVPSQGATQAVTCFDLIMMCCACGRERDEEAWTRLIEAADLKITKIWASPSAIESVIEVKLA